MNAADAILSLVNSARGTRPFSLDDPDAERTLNIVLALAVELAVSHERIDRLERMMAEQREMPLEELRALRFEGEAAQERQADMDAFLARVLRTLIDPRQGTAGRPHAP